MSQAISKHMLYSEFKTAIRTYIADGSADVTRAAEDAIRYMSNFFWNEDEDRTLTGNGTTTEFTKPSGTLYVYGVRVGDDDYERIDLEERKRFEVCMAGGQERYFETAGKINFLAAPANGLTITIHRRKGFTVPATDATALDIPDRYLPLAVLNAAMRQLRMLVILTAKQREDMPDVDVNEIRRVLKELSDEFDQEVKRIKQANV